MASELHVARFWRNSKMAFESFIKKIDFFFDVDNNEVY
jgi:hypothetical protein